MADESKNGTKQYSIWFTINVMETLKQFISHKWPNFTRGLISAEVERYVKEGLEREMGTHAHKTTVLREAENKPNWHSRKKGIVRESNVPVPEAVPSANAIVLNNNGNSSGGQQHSQSDFRPFEWANMMGIEITDKHSELAKRTRDDPAFLMEKFTEYKNRLIAMRNRSISNNVDIKTSERKKDNIEKMREIILFLDRNDLLDKEGRATKDDFKSAVSAVYQKNDHRPINAIIRNLISDGEIAEVTLGHVIHGKPHGRRDMTHYLIIDKDILLK